jgi:hypothetical protein
MKTIRERKNAIIIGAGGIGFWLTFRILQDYRDLFDKIVLCDFDKVEWHNLNRLPFLEEDVSHPKVEVAKKFFSIWWDDEVADKIIPIEKFISNNELEELCKEYQPKVVFNVSDSPTDPIPIRYKCDYVRAGCDGVIYSYQKTTTRERMVVLTKGMREIKPEERQTTYQRTILDAVYFAGWLTIFTYLHRPQLFAFNVVLENIKFETATAE